MSEKPIRVVIDTQVFLRAAINRKSLPAKIVFDLNIAYQLVISPAIIEEIEDVLNRPKIRAKFSSLTDEIVNSVIRLLKTAESVETPDIPAISRDPKDDIFLACAQASQAQYIISEDKDLLVLNPYRGIQIVDVAEFFELMKNR